ncbi:MAG: hypothetical protein M0030_06950 [Actinomycetota bacterium]|nr:hypothetical protein [Actinomycetota bacterium]
MPDPVAVPQPGRNRAPGGDPVVDTPSAQEFQREILDKITVAELQSIADRLDRKSRAMREVLLATEERLDAAALRRVLGLIFATRRRADQIIEDVGADRLAAAIVALVADAGDVAAQGQLAARFDAFDAALAGQPEAGFDLPGELLHFTYPGQYWLWTRWLWDPRTRTGALPLVTTDQVDLSGAEGRGATYLTVGRATAFVNETGKAAGFTDAAPGLFGTDIFLAAVYGVYMYTVLRMRMTKEFNELVPALPDLIRRLLGIYYQEG